MVQIECNKCKQQKKDTEFFDGIECYNCWEQGINEEKVKELRDQLSQYIDIDNVKIKENLTLEQLENSRRIIKANYVVGSDTIGGKASKEGGKELIKALWVIGQKNGLMPSTCLSKLDLRIKKLRPDPDPLPVVPKKIEYTRNCPICNEKFFHELKESDTSEQKANDILSEEVNEHIKEVHEKKNKEKNDPNERKENKSDSSTNQKPKQTNSPVSSKSNENKVPLPLIIGSLFLVSALVLVVYFLIKKRKSKK